MSLTIRVATLNDAAIVAELFTEFNALLGTDGLPEEDSYDPELIAVSEAQMAQRLAAMTGVETVLLAETAEGVAGLCCLRMIPYIGQDVPYAEVTQLYVRAAFKRQGIGAELLRDAEARAQATGATCVHIITGQTNHDAQAFYRAQGYRIDDVVFDKYFSREAVHA